MPQLARYATVHRICFPQITTAEMLPLAVQPEAALSWKIGPSGPVGPDGYRLPAAVWCAVGLYADRPAAERAWQQRDLYMPFLADAVESWHGLLVPIANKGECNHLDRAQPGLLFDVAAEDPGGQCLVMTTAGFVLGPDLNIDRVIDFRRQVDTTNEWMGAANGCLANQVFTPHTVGDDGFTLSLWRDDASMLNAAYRPGAHRGQIERHRAEDVMDRSSFTRFRLLDTLGLWNGRNPALPA